MYIYSFILLFLSITIFLYYLIMMKFEYEIISIVKCIH